MQVEEAPITGGSTAIRRLKYVPSREVAQEQIVIIDPPAARPVAPNSPALEELKDPESPPAVDPTRIGLYRPYKHLVKYRFAQLATAACIAATTAALITLIMADRDIAGVIALAALATGFAAVFLGMRSRMSSRIAGYAVAACTLSVIATII